MGLALQEDKGYTALKLNDKNVEGNMKVTQEDLNTRKTETMDRKLSKCLQENHVDKECFLS
jgi:hypothetical protein